MICKQSYVYDNVLLKNTQRFLLVLYYGEGWNFWEEDSVP